MLEFTINPFQMLSRLSWPVQREDDTNDMDEPSGKRSIVVAEWDPAWSLISSDWTYWSGSVDNIDKRNWRQDFGAYSGHTLVNSRFVIFIPILNNLTSWR